MNKRVLFAALILLSVSGLMLHYRIHSFLVPDKLNPGSVIFDSTRFLAAFFNVLDVTLVTVLYLSRRTAVYGYLLNGVIVIYGSVFMAHYSIAEMIAKGIPFPAIVLKSTLPDIGIAWADFFVGKALYDLYMKEH